ncbi:hypothetical protein, partial [Pseudomonas gessardii]|uniref:hypothetical protein n=1 Tax=Pseudomonas gessardii TaxID=78544 RepID=UPI001F3F10B7
MSIASQLNNAAQAVVDYTDTDGNGSTAVWNITAGTLNLVSALSVGGGSSGVGLAGKGNFL